MKCIDIINDALFAVGATSQYKPASPEMISISFRRLIQWVNQLAASGVTLGIPATQPPPAQVGDELGNAPEYDLALSAGFAPVVSPLFKRPVPSQARQAAKDAMDELYASFLKAAPPEWPETLPIGAGNTRGPKGRVYFPVPEDVYFIDQETEETTP